MCIRLGAELVPQIYNGVSGDETNEGPKSERERTSYDNTAIGDGLVYPQSIGVHTTHQHQNIHTSPTGIFLPTKTEQICSFFAHVMSHQTAASRISDYSICNILPHSKLMYVPCKASIIPRVRPAIIVIIFIFRDLIASKVPFSLSLGYLSFLAPYLA